MPTGDSTTASDAGEAVVIDRVFDAPRELVWRAWTEAEYVQRWFGPDGMTSHVCEIDLREGGRYIFGMQAPDGREYFMGGVYREVMPHERFVATAWSTDAHGTPLPPSPGEPGETLLTVVLEDLDGARTRMTMTQAGFANAEMSAGAGGGWNQAFEKLARVLRDG